MGRQRTDPKSQYHGSAAKHGMITDDCFKAPIDFKIAARATDGCPSTISSGGIAGIVLGSIAGTLLLLWLWRLCTMPGVWGSSEPDVGYRPPSTRARGSRRRSTGSYVDVVEKPRVSRSTTRRYRDDVRRPAKVYLS